MKTGCAFATFAPNSTMSSESITSVYEQVVAAMPIVRFSAVVDGCMAHARRVVDVVGAEEPDHLLRGVVHLVGDPARGEIEREAVGRDRTDALGREREGVVPRDPREALLALAPEHRIRQPAELTQLTAVELPQLRDVGEDASGRARRTVLSLSSSSRVVQRCTPSSVQSWNPATPSAQPSQTPLRRIFHAYGRCLRFCHTTFAIDA